MRTNLATAPHPAGPAPSAPKEPPKGPPNPPSTVDKTLARTVLLICHCAGMVDLIAMPVWMEVLITRYGLGPQYAGALVSVFLLAAVVTSSLLATRFERIRPKRVAVAGYAVAAAAFAAMATTADFALLCGLSVLGGAGVGCGLSLTHGSMGRSSDPHKLFGMAGAAAGVFSIAFYGAVTAQVARHGGPALFWVLAGVMAAATLAGMVGFPALGPAAAGGRVGGWRALAGQAGRSAAPRAARRPLPLPVWLAICGVVGIALNQAIASSFLQNIGLARGFGAERVQAVLVSLGLLTLVPGPLALALRHRLSARAVLIVGPLLQIAIVATISQSLHFWPYAVAGALSISVQIFMHTFAFGFIAKGDPSGRAAAATPAMLMTGSAVGPFLAGTLVANAGYTSLGWAVGAIALVAAACFWTATAGQRRTPAVSPVPAAGIR